MQQANQSLGPGMCMEKLRVSVKSLVEHSLRRGDLRRDPLDFGNPLTGIKIHQRLQGQRPTGYRREVTLCYGTELDGFELEVQGRVDGILDLGERIVVEEIKTTTRDLSELERDQSALHWGQLKVYAFLIALDRGLEEVDTRLTYCRQESLETLELNQAFSRVELSEFFEGLLASYAKWARKMRDWFQLRNESIQELEFPFHQYRKGQREMAVAIYRVAEAGGQLLIQAPTGIGKTLAAIFPAVKLLSVSSGNQICYLTAKTTGQVAAEDAVAGLRGQGLRLKSLTLTAKDRICFSPGSACNGDECEFAGGFYDRLGEALEGLFEFDCLDRATIELLARRHKVCPFELSLELSSWADILIGDYNYAFDPRVSLKRLFSEQPLSRTVLVDEAHNLLERSREMYSSELWRNPFVQAASLFKKQAPSLHRKAGRIARWFSKAEEDQNMTGAPPYESGRPLALERLLRRFSTEAQRWLVLPESRLSPDREVLLDLFFNVVGFLRVGEQYDSAYATCYLRDGTDVGIKLFCLDPSRQLKGALRVFRCTVLFSATLTPTEFYRNCLGCSDSDQSLVLPSPFPAQNLRVLIAHNVSTRYHDRPRSRERVAALLHDFALARQGNYLFFFPSYQYLQMIYESFACQNTGRVRTMIQSGGMTLDERDSFLLQFTPAPQETLVGFAVMGGLFGEGIDLVGERLTGVAVIGVGLPAVCLERELIRGYFDDLGEDGFDFSYRYPGMTRVRQAVGRLIRSEDDRGVALLIDERFSKNSYRALFPADWVCARVASVERLKKELQSFWEEESLLEIGARL